MYARSLSALHASYCSLCLRGSLLGLLLLVVVGNTTAQQGAPFGTGGEVLAVGETAPRSGKPEGDWLPTDRASFDRMVDEAIQRRDAEKKKKDDEAKAKKEAEGVVVGSDLSLVGNWSNGLFFQSPNKDWNIHIGGRFQFESVWWREPTSLQGAPVGNGGIPGSPAGGGVGTLDDGMFFRRVRLRSDGVGYETVEYVTEVDFEQLNFITFDHVWAGFKELPFLGTVRIGQHKVPQGLEMMGSDYHLTFLERSSLSDAFWTLFAPGVFISNTYLDQRMTFQTMFHKIQPLQVYNAQFGDGDYAETSRLTFLPYYEQEGRFLVHLGGSYQWRHGNLGRTINPNGGSAGTGNAYGDSQSVAIFRARPELRDATGVSTVIGDSARFVSTGFVLASNVHTVSPEFLWINGPFSFQAEGAWSYAENVRSLYPASAFNTPRGTCMFWGAYAQASYMITGEHRGYDRRFGTFDRPKVSEDFFRVRGEDGCIHQGWGAWEVAYRYSFMDLNDNGVNGGQMGQHTLGLNWYFNDNFKIQFNYINIERNVAAPANSGTVQGFGVLAQWYF